MPEKRSFPLKNPPQEKTVNSSHLHCPYCSWYGFSSGALDYHINHHHEAVVAAEGKKSLRKGGDRYEGTRQLMLARGYHECKWEPAMCPGAINLMAQMLCKHLDECPWPDRGKGVQASMGEASPK